KCQIRRILIRLILYHRLRSKDCERFHKPERNRLKLGSCLPLGVRPYGLGRVLVIFQFPY
ncbi:Uncharacterized protein APZ42_010656, partial [Daphnia magna]